MQETTIQVRCSFEQKNIVIARMKKAGFSNLSEYCRVKLTEGEPIETAPPPELKKTIFS